MCDNKALMEKGTATETEPKALAVMDEAMMQAVSGMVRQILAPVMENIGAIFQRTNEAIERIAASEQTMSARISDLEKEVRLKTPVNRAQERHLSDAIRSRAREIMDKKGFGEDKKAVTKLGGRIRKSVLARYGVERLRDVPAYDYDVAMEQISTWNDALAVFDVMKDAIARTREAET